MGEKLIPKIDGSSPRGRGTRCACTHPELPSRFIPAWAGNAVQDVRERIKDTVHPRVGGERIPPQIGAVAPTGSSPRGRGTRTNRLPRSRPSRFIPAWAGNAGPNRGRMISRPVHPRVGGERRFRQIRHRHISGSSPRGRGTPHIEKPVHVPTRFIPAWAGNAVMLGSAVEITSVHPRVGGERAATISLGQPGPGSSPRGRGTPQKQSVCGVSPRFIPAWAGNAGRSRPGGVQVSVHPRVGGERRWRATYGCRRDGSSPRGRGTHDQHHGIPDHPRFIPAWAGNAYQNHSKNIHGSVHPRVGGERVTTP